MDPLNRSALISAIENENFDLIIVLLECGIEVGDALLHAISEEYVEAVEELLQWEETHHKEGQPYVSIENGTHKNTLECAKYTNATANVVVLVTFYTYVL